jgi:hypothetical protein
METVGSNKSRMSRDVQVRFRERLKVKPLRPTRLNYYTRELMNEGDNKPIGIVLGAEKNCAVVEYTLPDGNTQIFASKYKLYLPTEEELKRELNLDKFTALELEVSESQDEEQKKLSTVSVDKSV